MIAIVRLLVVASILLAASPAGADLEAGRAAFERGEYATAYKEYFPAAEEGVPVAQYTIGGMYYLGLHVAQDDRKAFEWLKKAADQGFAGAQHLVGYLIGQGRGGVEQDDEEAAKWFRKAAEQGFAASQYNLGRHFELGMHSFLLLSDYQSAAKWYRKAAEQGDGDAMFRLAGLHARGVVDGTVDRSEAQRLAEAAVKKEHDKAQQLIKLLTESALSDRELSKKVCYLMYIKGPTSGYCPD